VSRRRFLRVSSRTCKQNFTCMCTQKNKTKTKTIQYNTIQYEKKKTIKKDET
jgi:hypothetical protein